ncbi:MAG: hypothetical protein PHN55_13435 [Dysgonamonadaceae bacterium]|nr:hypothetical protein [Dysgonamonadaceae bacterium]
MKKIIAMIICFIFVLALVGCSQKEPSIVNTYEVTATELTNEYFDNDKLVTLVGNDEADGMYTKMSVYTKDKNKVFQWSNVTNPTYAPTINIADVDDDGKEEVIIILTIGYGTGVLQQEIRLLNMEDLSEISIQNPVEAINEKITSTIIKGGDKVNVTVKWDGKMIDQSYYNPNYSGFWFEEVSFGDRVSYDIIEDKIIASVLGAISPSGFPITVFLEYDSNLEVNNIAIKLYEIYPYDAFDLPLTKIPYYQRGEIVFKDEVFFEQWQEGHQPWLANAVDVVTAMCSNLIGSSDQTFDNDNIELHTANELRTKDGIVIKVMDKVGNEVRVELIVPNLGRYEIILESPDTTSVLFIRNIIFYPN